MHRFKVFVWTVCLSCFFMPFNIFAQAPQLKFRQINIEQGLSNSWVESIFQDSRGFVWVGTRNGLDRYDGQQITAYTNSITDTNTISNNYIRCIFEDNQHRLWIGTSDGLNLFNESKGIFVRYKHHAANKGSLSDNQVSCIYQDKQHNLWVATLGGGLDLFDPATGMFRHFQHNANDKNSISDDLVNGICQDTNGNIWVATDSGLDLCRPVGKSFTFSRHVFGSSADNGLNTVRLVQADRSGNIWLGIANAGVVFFNPSNNTFKQYRHQQNNPNSLSGDEVHNMLADKDGEIWIGVINEGLNQYNPQTDSFWHYQYDFSNPSSLSQKSASAIFKDHQGNLWVGTHRGGVNLYSPGANRFNLYQQEIDPLSLSSSDVKTFCQDKNGNIWVGTDGGGLNLFNRKKNTFKHYRNKPSDDKSLGSDAVLDIYQDAAGNIWVSTWGGGLNLFNAASGTFTRFKTDGQNKGAISANTVQKTYQDVDGNLWVGTYYGGLNLFDAKTRKFKRVIKDPDGVSSFMGNNVVAITGDKDGNVWFGTDDGGLNRYNLKTRRFSHYFTSEVPRPDFRVLFNDSEGRLWVGQQGLYLFDRAQNKFSVFTKEAGLADEFIRGITEDKFGKLWISTNKGITRLRPSDKYTTKFNIADGLQGIEFESNAFLRADDDEMFFGGTKGLNTFYPKNIKKNMFVPPVYITSFQIFNKDITPQQPGSPLQNDITFTNNITLPYNQSSVSFGFASLNYVIPENNQYAYKLEPFDRDWVTANSQRRASYTNLSPGKYTFRVKASNNDGVWNEKGATISIIVRPPFWETWWFEAISALAIIGVVYAYFLLRTNSIRKQRTKLEKQVKERTAEVVLKAEELQTLNQDLSAKSEELTQQAEDLKQLNAELARQKEQELEKAISQGKFEIASEVLHDIGNAMVGFGSHLNRISFALAQGNLENVKSLAVFLKNQQSAIGGAIGEDKAAALVAITDGIAKTQVRNKDEIEGSINELLSIITHIQEILNIQRQFVRGHGGVHERKPVNLISIIEDCKSMLYATFDKKVIQFNITVSPGDYVIKGDHTKLMQVILNILKNSIEAIDIDAAEKKITITMQRKDNLIELMIADTGQGFDAETGTRLFERGFTTKKAGTGLGLYNCRSIIESHAGSFELYSAGPGLGATVMIKLAL